MTARADATTTATVSITVDGVVSSIDHRRIAGPAGAPLFVFLHEGLGAVSTWKDFPDRLCAAGGFGGLVYSRAGFGRSSPRAGDLAPDFMHREAQRVLPALLTALGIDVDADPPWLFGHSDGGSIALIHAATFPSRVAGLVVVAPHLDVEQRGLDSIAAVDAGYGHDGLRERLARHHDDVDAVFRGWSGIWLSPAFRDWDIRALLPRIACPVLAIQGREDRYGTMAQIDRIATALPATALVKLDGCDHWPQRDAPEAVIDATVHFVDARRSEGRSSDPRGPGGPAHRPASNQPVRETS